ncbi:MAG: hypothetical protein PHW04_08290 [Candidatus Wallbacteria bacterium]|nr:hypothetical protein [Candidatus Wallbacteria bacterium]
MIKFKEIRNKYVSLCCQGDLISAYEYLCDLKNPGTSAAKLRDKVKRRFFSLNHRYSFKTGDPFLRRICRAYCEYITSVLTRKQSADAAEKVLLERLATIMGASGKPDSEKLESLISEKVGKKGFHFLGGKTSGLLGPYIYEKSEKKIIKVALPDGSYNLPVFFLRGFLMRSWLSYATFDLAGTGGWAKKDGLYCVHKCYAKKMNTDDFQVSFLRHEAQHFSDYKKYPDLCQIDLEYRAKLVELIYWKKNRRLLWFASEAKNDRSQPHSFASYQIITRLQKAIFPKSGKVEPKWEKVDYSLIRQQALELFNNHTAGLFKNSKGIL